MAKKFQLKLPPQNVEVEQSVLGSLLIDKSAITKVADFLKPEDFYVPAHEKIYGVLFELYEKQQPIDILSLTSKLKEKDILKDIGGSSYLAELTNQVPTASHVEHYAKIVKEKKILRDLIKVSGEITEDAFEPSNDTGELLDSIEQKFLSISQKSLIKNFVAVKDELKGAYERIEALHQGKGGLRGITTGFDELDNTLSGLQPSDLVVIGARPSLGKTTFALDIARNCALKTGLPVGVFTLEMSRDQVIDRLIAAESQVPLWRLRTGRITDDLEFEMIQNALDRLSKVNIYIDDTPSPNILQIRSMARRLQVEKGLALLVVDYLQLITARNGYDNMVQQITEISRGLKSLARELKVPIIAISQLSRAVDQRDHKVPRLSDLRESGCLSGDTLIMRADTGELVTIKKLADRASQDPIPVWTLDSNLKLTIKPLTKAFSSGRKQIFELKLRSGRAIQASANHPFKTLTEWTAIENLTPGNRIALPRQILPSNPQLVLQDNEIILLAHLTGDGCVLPRQPIHYTSGDERNITAVREAAESIFGIKGRIVKQKNWWHVYLPSPYHLTHGKHHPIINWYRQLGIAPVYSYKKVLPAALFTLPNDKIALFLHHLWATDGNISWKTLPDRKPAAAIYYASTSKILIGQLQHLFLRFGIQSTIRIAKKEHYRPNYQLHIQGKDNQLQFLKIIGSFGNRGEQVQAMINALDVIAPNPNLDVIPKEAWRYMVEPAKVAAGMSWRDVAAGLTMSYCGSTLLKHGIGRARLNKLAHVLGNERIGQYAESEIYWDEIISITPCGTEEVYDATVHETHNFVANDIVVHNSIEQDADVVLFIYRKDRDKIDIPVEEQNIAQIIIAKHRNGPLGSLLLRFDPERVTFKSIERKYAEEGVEV